MVQILILLGVVSVILLQLWYAAVTTDLAASEVGSYLLLTPAVNSTSAATRQEAEGLVKPQHLTPEKKRTSPMLLESWYPKGNGDENRQGSPGLTTAANERKDDSSDKSGPSTVVFLIHSSMELSSQERRFGIRDSFQSGRRNSSLYYEMKLVFVIPIDEDQQVVVPQQQHTTLSTEMGEHNDIFFAPEKSRGSYLSMILRYLRDTVSVEAPTWLVWIFDGEAVVVDFNSVLYQLHPFQPEYPIIMGDIVELGTPYPNLRNRTAFSKSMLQQMWDAYSSPGFMKDSSTKDNSDEQFFQSILQPPPVSINSTETTPIRYVHNLLSMHEKVSPDAAVVFEHHMTATSSRATQLVKEDDGSKRTTSTYPVSNANATGTGLRETNLNLQQGMKDLRDRIRTVEKELRAGMEQMNGTMSRVDPLVFEPIPSADKNITFEPYLLPLPNLTNSKIVFLVMSGQDRLEYRQGIRESWAAEKDNVYFLVGHSSCNLREHSKGFAHCRDEDHGMLMQEQLRFGDLVEIPIPEVYHNLPEKMVQAYHFVLSFLPNVDFMVKIDDDCFARPSSMERFLEAYDPNANIVLGNIRVGIKPNRQGKWAEHKYHQDIYPPWPLGSSGYALSRTTAQHMVDHSSTLVRYQGEDTSLGIWMSELGLEATFVSVPSLVTHRGKNECRGPKLIVGHKLTPWDLKTCHKAGTQVMYGNIWEQKLLADNETSL